MAEDAPVECEVFVRHAIDGEAPFDMFPLTEHLEVVAVLEKVSG